ncbi:MAG TPA: BON domain-containing protein, partial [Casimicrobiaceae bacterium]
GPKGYERSDERLKEDVSERMYAGDWDTSDVSVEVESGVVTLDGTVDDRQTKYMLEEMVDNIPGVKDVENRLRIRRGGEQWQSEGRGTSGTSMLGSTSSTGGYPTGRESASGSSGASSSGTSGSSGSGTSGSSGSGSSGSSSSGSRSSGSSSSSRRSGQSE